MSQQNSAIDIDFHVPCVHRLRFTKDLFGKDQEVLLDLLEPSGDKRPRVQVWVDEQVAKAQPDLSMRIRTFASRHGDQFELIGKIQTCPGGEAVKNDIHIIERMLKVINAADLDRRSYIVVIGGGAVLDAVGFCCSDRTSRDSINSDSDHDTCPGRFRSWCQK